MRRSTATSLAILCSLPAALFAGCGSSDDATPDGAGAGANAGGAAGGVGAGTGGKSGASTGGKGGTGASAGGGIGGAAPGGAGGHAGTSGKGGANSGGKGGASTGAGGGGATTGAGGGGAGGAAAGGSGGSGQGGGLPPKPDKPELWYWHHSYLSSTSAVEPAQSMARIDAAVAAGYTGMALWDSSLTFLTQPGWDPVNMKKVVDYAVSKGLRVLPGTAPFGYSNDALRMNPNLAEGQRVVGTSYKASGGKLGLVNSLPPLANGDFEGGQTGWFTIGDPRVSLDTSVSHGGSASAHVAGQPGASDNARLSQAFAVTPWRNYHVRFYVKSSNLAKGDPMVSILDFTTTPNVTLTRFNRQLTLPATSDWTAIDFVFNSRDSQQVSLYVGIWGGNEGDLWLDDISAEETGLVNVLRRAGTPLRVYDAAGNTFAEGADVDPIADPAVAASGGNFDDYHAPPTVTLPAGSKIKEGAMVSIDHYTVFPAVAGGTGICLTEPDVATWLAADIQAIDAIFPAGSGMFLQYDEMRHMNSCASCRQKGLDAGALLAWHVGQSVAALQAARPGTDVYFWNDMFDRNHNAHGDYYYVEGDISGSWAGLPDSAIIMNWDLGNLTPSLRWFAGAMDPAQPRAFRQIIAGYYDSGDGAKAATEEMAAAKGIPGVVGLMYTTWQDDYSQLGSFAAAAGEAWKTYP